MTDTEITDPCLAELNRLAKNAEAINTASEEAELLNGTSDSRSGAASSNITNARNRWMKLFNYSPREASYLLETHRANVDREHITKEHWDLIKHKFEPAGYDKEAYEHLLDLENLMLAESGIIPAHVIAGLDTDEGETATQIFALRLGGLLTKDRIKEITGMEREPRVVDTAGERSLVQLCIVDTEQRQKVVQWLRLLKAGVGL